jgi:hypothetical protein
MMVCTSTSWCRPSPPPRWTLSLSLHASSTFGVVGDQRQQHPWPNPSTSITALRGPWREASLSFSSSVSITLTGIHFYIPDLCRIILRSLARFPPTTQLIWPIETSRVHLILPFYFSIGLPFLLGTDYQVAFQSPFRNISNINS